MTAYWAWYYIRDCHDRYSVRSEVWQHIMKRFAEAGVELALNPSEAQPPEAGPVAT